MKKFVCTVCGYIHEGETAPEVCPVCKVGAEKFEEMKGEMVWADEHRIGAAQGVDEEILEGLRANFVGECTEVGFGRMGLVDDCFIQATDETIVLFGCRQLLDIIIEVIKHSWATV